MRQLKAFLDRIYSRNTRKEWNYFNFFAKCHHLEMPSLEEFLPVTSESKSAFDKDAEEKMDAMALRMLEQRKAMSNVR